MKRHLALVLAMVIAIIPMSFVVSADESGLIVDVSLDNYATAGVTNAVAGNGTEFSWSVAPAETGSFANADGSTTSYLQFGVADGNGGFTADSGKNILKIEDADFLGTGAGTVSFWYYLENSGATDYNYHMKFTNGKMLYGLGTYSAANETFYAGGHNPYGKITKAWKYVTVTKEYNETDKQWEYNFYIDKANWFGGKKTASAESAADAGYYYEFGAGIPAKFSGIKIYNRALSASEIETVYNAEKNQYVEYIETETAMKLTSPSKDGILSRKGGELTLSFNSIPDKDTLSGITLTKAGDSTNLITNKTVDSVNKTVTLTYGAPEEAYSYELGVSGVKSISGLEMTEAVTLNYTVGTSLAVSVDMSETGVSNTGSDTAATVTVEGSPEYGTFVNTGGGKTEYMQFGVVPEGATSGFDGTSKSNALLIKSDAVNNAKAGTVTFWANPDASLAGYTWANNLYLSYSNQDYLSTLTGAATKALFAVQPYADRNSALTTVVGSSPDHASFYENAVGTWRKLTVTWEHTGSAWEVKLYHNTSKMQDKTLAKEVDVLDWLIRVGYGYPGKISGIKVYDEAKTAEEITSAYNSEAASYTEYVETETEMKLVSPTAGGILSVNGGKLTLGFNSLPDSKTLSGITLTKSGDDTNLITEAVADTAAKTVKITYSALETGASYLLKVSGVKSLTGLEMSADSTLNYTAGTAIPVDIKLSSAGAVNSGSDTEATVTVNGSPAYGSFDNENGTKTSYFQMGESDGAGGFTGTTKENYITVASNNINAAKEGTITFWANHDTTMGQEAVEYNYAWGTSHYLRYGSSDSYLYLLQPSYGDNSRFNFIDIYNDATGNEYAVLASPQSWYQVTVAWKYDTENTKWTARVYTNGASEKAFETATDRDLTDYVFRLGYGFPGKMSGIKIYDTAKTADEIKALYDGEAGNYREFVAGGAVEIIGDISFTDENGSAITSFAGKTKVTASFMVLNTAGRSQDILPILAIYEGTEEGTELKKIALGSAGTVSSNATGDFSVTLELTDITLNENQSIKLLVWENLTTLKPIFATPEPLLWGLRPPHWKVYMSMNIHRQML